MIALTAALLLAQAPAPAGAAPGARTPEDAGRAAEVRGARTDEPPDPASRGDRGRADDRARDRAPLPDPRDEAVIRDLELLENLGLLQELELFDGAGDPPPRATPPAPPPRTPEDPARRRGDAPRR